MADGSLSQFKATLARKMARNAKQRDKFDRKKLGFKGSDYKPEYNFPELSASELEEVKRDIRTKLKKQRQRELLIIAIITLGLICLLIYLN